MNAQAIATEVIQKLILNAVEQFVIRTVLRLIELTPVDTGLMQRSWTITVNVVDGSISAQERFSLQLPSWKLGDIIYIINGAPYEVYVELGTLRQAPAAIVALTAAELAAEALAPPGFKRAIEVASRFSVGAFQVARYRLEGPHTAPGQAPGQP